MLKHHKKLNKLWINAKKKAVGWSITLEDGKETEAFKKELFRILKAY